jgi:hypothetical protein
MLLKTYRCTHSFGKMRILLALAVSLVALLQPLKLQVTDIARLRLMAPGQLTLPLRCSVLLLSSTHLGDRRVTLVCLPMLFLFHSSGVAIHCSAA